MQKPNSLDKPYPVNTDSIDDLDPRTVSRSIAERFVAANNRRLDGFGEGDVQGVIGADVIPQLPRTTSRRSKWA
jgi:hypothetical protein